MPVVYSWHGDGKTISVYALLSRCALQATLSSLTMLRWSRYTSPHSKVLSFVVRIERGKGVTSPYI
jgi:hypothetical protein